MIKNTKGEIRKLFQRYLCRDWLVFSKMDFLIAQKIILDIAYAI